MTSYRYLVVALGIAAPQLAAAQQNPTIRSYYEMARAEFSGERARDVVAFMDGRFRWPGNTGFDASIDNIVRILRSAGYVPEDSAQGKRFTYRMEKRPIRGLAWDLVSASLAIVGDSAPLLTTTSNLNMLAINSYSTPDTGIVADVVDAGKGTAAELDALNVKGKVVLADASVGQLFGEAVQKRGAAGVLAYRMPAYTKPEINRSSIQFSSIAQDTVRKGWGMPISRGALDALRARLAKGPVRVRAITKTRLFPSVERTVVAEVRGAKLPNERFVFSAHVQEPGANDNASGVGALSEIARLLAVLPVTPSRTITMLFGNEIAQTQNFLADDAVRTRDVKWGLSLDMVGEDTQKTGGAFLIEKMPDPSAVWTRGDEKHSEWGGSAITKDKIVPHYFNDFLLARCLDQAKTNGWVVKTNPFEGGSDHTPFLTFKKPGVLFWHFTDQFYHTDGDRLDKVSAVTLKNVGVSALVSALTLTTANGEMARSLVGEIEAAAIKRLDVEFALSKSALASGGDVAKEREILETWATYYDGALAAMVDIEVGGSSTQTQIAIAAARQRVVVTGKKHLASVSAR